MLKDWQTDSFIDPEGVNHEYLYAKLTRALVKRIPKLRRYFVEIASLDNENRDWRYSSYINTFPDKIIPLRGEIDPSVRLYYLLSYFLTEVMRVESDDAFEDSNIFAIICELYGETLSQYQLGLKEGYLYTEDYVDFLWKYVLREAKELADIVLDFLDVYKKEELLDWIHIDDMSQAPRKGEKTSYLERLLDPDIEDLPDPMFYSNIPDTLQKQLKNPIINFYLTNRVHRMYYRTKMLYKVKGVLKLEEWYFHSASEEVTAFLNDDERVSEIIPSLAQEFKEDIIQTFASRRAVHLAVKRECDVPPVPEDLISQALDKEHSRCEPSFNAQLFECLIAWDLYHVFQKYIFLKKTIPVFFTLKFGNTKSNLPIDVLLHIWDFDPIYDSEDIHEQLLQKGVLSYGGVETIEELLKSKAPPNSQSVQPLSSVYYSNPVQEDKSFIEWHPEKRERQSTTAFSSMLDGLENPLNGETLLPFLRTHFKKIAEALFDLQDIYLTVFMNQRGLELIERTLRSMSELFNCLSRHQSTDNITSEEFRRYVVQYFRELVEEKGRNWDLTSGENNPYIALVYPDLRAKVTIPHFLSIESGEAESFVGFTDQTSQGFEGRKEDFKNFGNHLIKGFEDCLKCGKLDPGSTHNSLQPIFKRFFGRYGFKFTILDDPHDCAYTDTFEDTDFTGATHYLVDYDEFKGFLGSWRYRNFIRYENGDYLIPREILPSILAERFGKIAITVGKRGDEDLIDEYLERFCKFLAFHKNYFDWAYEYILLYLRRGKDFTVEQKVQWHIDLEAEYKDTYVVRPLCVCDIEGNEDGFLRIEYENILTKIEDLSHKIEIEKTKGNSLSGLLAVRKQLYTRICDSLSLRRYIKQKRERAERRGKEEERRFLEGLMFKTFSVDELKTMEELYKRYIQERKKEKKKSVPEKRILDEGEKEVLDEASRREKKGELFSEFDRILKDTVDAFLRIPSDPTKEVSVQFIKDCKEIIKKESEYGFKEVEQYFHAYISQRKAEVKDYII